MNTRSKSSKTVPPTKGSKRTLTENKPKNPKKKKQSFKKNKSKSIHSKEENEYQFDNDVNMPMMTIICGICDEPMIRSTQLSCQHFVCSPCWKTNISVNGLKVRCPDCKEIAKKNEIYEFLLNVDPLLQFRLQEFELREQYSQCPKCLDYYFKDSVNYNSGKEEEKCSSLCPTCKTPLCFTCGRISHEPKTCDQVAKSSEDYSLQEYFKQNEDKTRRCPSCYQLVEKDKGCSHFLCPYCQIEFCFNCREIWTPTHPFSTCEYIFHPPKFLTIQMWGDHYINRTRRFVLQKGQFRFFVDGLTAFANTIIRWEINKDVLPLDLIKIFGMRFREFPLELPNKVTSEIFKQSVTSFINLYFKQCIIFYIVFIELKKPENNKSEDLKKILNDIIVKDIIRSILKEVPQGQGPIIEFFNWVKEESNQKSLFHHSEVENWIKQNLFKSFEKLEKGKDYFQFVNLYHEDTTFEKLFEETQRVATNTAIQEETNNNNGVVEMIQ
jgi:hypothetical protein